MKSKFKIYNCIIMLRIVFLFLINVPSNVRRIMKIQEVASLGFISQINNGLSQKCNVSHVTLRLNNFTNFAFKITRFKWGVVLTFMLVSSCCPNEVLDFASSSVSQICLFVCIIILYQYSIEQKASEGLTTWLYFQSTCSKHCLYMSARIPCMFSKGTKCSHMGWPCSMV